MAFIDEKGLTYKLINVSPLGEPDPDFLKISPMGKVPVLGVDGRHMPDSLAACAFLEGVAPDRPLFPSDSWQHGWMLWLCDYLGTGLFSKVEAPLFIQRFVNPVFLGKETDNTLVDLALGLLPSHYDYLEAQFDDGTEYLIGDALTLADLTAASIFINMLHAGEPVDAERWPKLAAYVDRMLARPSISKLLNNEREVLGDRSPLFAS